jgi:nitric oxide reductase NorQ protein
MAATNTDTERAVETGEKQAVLTHLVQQLLQREGGSIPLERVTLRVSDFADIGEQEAADLIDQGADVGIYKLDQGAGGNTCIVGVTTQGPQPDVITAAFGDAPAIAGDDFTAISVVTDSINTALQSAGYESFSQIANAETQEIAGLTGTLTESRAEALIEEAVQHTPVGYRLARSADNRYGRRLDEQGRGTARILDLAQADQTVGEPLYRSEGWDPDDPQGMYCSDIGANSAGPTPIPTGLHILDDSDHPDVPKAAIHPEAGDDALPVDDQGEVIPPAVPIEPRLQLPLDELIAKKLARGLVPIRVVGPRGSGKNYLLKYLCHRTNRGYVSIDCDAATHTEDLFGPLTPNEDGIIVPRNGAVKQGLLNGSVVVLNEFPVMRAGAAMSLHRVLNEGTLLIKSHGELIEPHPSARLVITMNPPTREYRDSEPMNSATRGRFRGFEQPYIQDIEEEVTTLDRQVNRSFEVLDRVTLRKIVQFAHQTRQNESWPTLSTRNLTILCEHIEDGASPKAATKNELWAVAEPNQYPEDAHETLGDYL